MNLKKHVCGVAIVFDQVVRREHPRVNVVPSRPNGSLHNRQRRSIADATEYLRIKHRNDRQRKPVIFCLTSPGFVSVANTPKFISCFVENMRANYGMGEYVWVREHTKRGFPHFHFIAEWNKSNWFFESVVYRGKSMPRITAISLYWSGLFGSEAVNSVRLGSFHPETKKRTLYVSHSKQCWYLAKYIGKSLGDSPQCSYLTEAGFPATKYRKSVRGFAISESLRQWSEPTMFDGEIVDTITGEVIPGYIGPDRRVERRFHSWNSGQLVEVTEGELTAYSWRWTGHGQTFIGFLKVRSRVSQ